MKPDLLIEYVVKNANDDILCKMAMKLADKLADDNPNVSLLLNRMATRLKDLSDAV
ncbi:MAG TPA: hypothetical protein VD794_12970 [Flavisolibacter sp.]|nr:hypothetical protein [Flavisolibacter sp.]